MENFHFNRLDFEYLEIIYSRLNFFLFCFVFSGDKMKNWRKVKIYISILYYLRWKEIEIEEKRRKKKVQIHD